MIENLFMDPLNLIEFCSKGLINILSNFQVLSIMTIALEVEMSSM